MPKILFNIIILALLQLSAIAQNYNRIISLAPSLTKNLYYLKVNHHLVGCTNYCEIAKNDSKEIVASAIKVNIEKVLSLHPNLVIASTLTNPETIEMLKKLGITVKVFPKVTSFAELCRQFEELGTLTGKKEYAHKIVTDAKNSIDSIQKQCTWNTAPNIFFQIGAKPLYTVIPNTFMNDYITFVNGKNIASDFTLGSITRESVIARNPDYIFIVTMGIVGKEEKSTWTSFKELTASKNGNIFIIDSDMACTPTPITFVETLREMTTLMKNNIQPNR